MVDLRWPRDVAVIDFRDDLPQVVQMSMRIKRMRRHKTAKLFFKKLAIRIVILKVSRVGNVMEGV